MPEPVQFGLSELRTRFGISARLITRIGALMKHRIGVTATVLECARPGSPMEAFLLGPLLSLPPGELRAEDLNRACRECGGQEGLALTSWEGWQVISLKEELDAEDGWDAGESPLALSLRAGPSVPTAIPGLADTAGLFSADDIRRLTLAAVAGSDVSQRVSAIRQLALSPASPRDKAAVFINLLGDDEPRIRAEAASALQTLGLNQESGEAIRELATGEGPQRLLAARRLSQLIGRSSGLETLVILRALLRGLEHEPDLAVRAAMLGAVTVAAPWIGSQPPELQQTVRVLVRQIREHPKALRREAERALEAFASHGPDPVTRILWDQVQTESETEARIEVLCFLAQHPLPDEIREQVVREMAAQLGAIPTNDERAIRLGNLLVPHGDAAALALLDVFPKSHRHQHTHFVELLDRLASDRRAPLRPEVKESVADLFLKLLRSGERTVRLAVIEGNLCGVTDLSPAIRRQMIQELFANLHEYHNPRTRSLVETTVSLMGLPAVDPLMDIVREGTRRDERQLALSVLGQVFGRIQEGGAEVAEAGQTVLACCRRIVAEEPVEMVAVALDAMGDIGTCRLLPPETLSAVSRDLRASLRKSPRAFEVLRALGKICGNPSAPLADRLDTANLFLQLLRSDLPTVQAQSAETDEELVVYLGREILAYTDMVPTVLDGLQTLSLSDAVPVTLRERIVDALRTKWRALIEYREVWGPGNQLRLLATLRTIGVSPLTSSGSRRRLFETWQQDLDRPHVLAALGEICYRVPKDPQAAPMVPGILERALAYWIDRERMDRSDAPMVLRALGQMIVVTPPGSDGTSLARLRARVLALLYSALREKVTSMDEVLRALAEAPSLPEAMRQDIIARLRDTFAIVKR